MNFSFPNVEMPVQRPRSAAASRQYTLSKVWTSCVMRARPWA